MGWYDNTKVKRLKNGILVKKTTIYDKIPNRDDDILVMSTEGDRFDLLAHQYYGDSELWWVIAWYNQTPTESHVELGDVLQIPLPLHKVLSSMGV